MSKILIICSQSIDDLGLFNDIKNDDDYMFRVAYEKEYTRKSIKSFVMTILKKVHLNPIVNKVINLPGKYIWHSYYDVRKQIKDIDTIIIMNGAVRFIDYDFLHYCKKHNSGVKVYLYFIDSLQSQSPALVNSIDKIFKYNWDEIFTFDPVDAKENGFRYLGFSYFSISHKVDGHSPAAVSDLFFAGGLKGNREKLIIETYQYLTENGINSDFILSTYGKELKGFPTGIDISEEFRSYQDILKRTLNSNCILEILQEGQHGTSIRYFEAVCYNKKLLTNNPDIVNYPLYDERYMKVFMSPQDIDLQWIRSDMQPDYHYNNEFSPKNLKYRITNIV